MRRADFVIAGAGLSGLTLADELSAAFERRLVLVDPGLDADVRFDRTIGFWTNDAPPYPEVIERSWSQLHVDGPGGPRMLELGTRRYHTFRWSKLRAHLLARLRARPHVELRTGRVEAFHDLDPLDVIIDGEPVHTSFGFDSRLDLDRITCAPGRVLAWQRFLGWRIESDEPRFDPRHASFMDLRPSTRERLAFLNVLPETPSSALVYHVEVVAGRDAPDLDADLEHDLRAYLGLDGWRVLAREQGALPLSDQPWARCVGQRVLRIGIAGGRLKPSSGYAFTRILADNHATIASLHEHGHPFARPRERARHRWFDGVLLELLLRTPALGPELFAGLFRRCRTDAVFDFLDERGGIGTMLAVMTAMPHKLMLAHAGLRRSLSWLRAPSSPALPIVPEQPRLRG